MERSTKQQRSERAATARVLNLRSQDEWELDTITKPGLDRRPLWTRQKGVITMTQLRPSLSRCRENFTMVRILPFSSPCIHSLAYLLHNMSCKCWPMIREIWAEGRTFLEELADLLGKALKCDLGHC